MAKINLLSLLAKMAQIEIDIEDISANGRTVKSHDTVVNTTVGKPSSTKSGKSKSKPAKAGKTVAFGKVKKGDYFKVVVNDKVTRVGKANTVSVKDKILTAIGGKKYALDNCVAINKKEYGKLKKSLKADNEPKKSTSTRLSAADYKVVYAAYLVKQGKINEETFAKAKDSNEIATELYKQFKDDVKLSNAEALKLLAENSAKATA